MVVEWLSILCCAVCPTLPNCPFMCNVCLHFVMDQVYLSLGRVYLMKPRKLNGQRPMMNSVPIR